MQKGHDHIVALLLATGVDPNYAANTKGDPALAQAIPFEPIFRRLLEAGADWTAQASNGATVSALVLATGQIGELQMLLDHDVDLMERIHGAEEPPCTLLQLAVRRGETMLRHLLQQRKWNAQLLPGSIRAELAVHEAASKGHPALVQTLFDL